MVFTTIEDNKAALQSLQNSANDKVLPMICREQKEMENEKNRKKGELDNLGAIEVR